MDFMQSEISCHDFSETSFIYESTSNKSTIRDGNNMCVHLFQSPSSQHWKFTSRFAKREIRDSECSARRHQLKTGVGVSFFLVILLHSHLELFLWQAGSVCRKNYTISGQLNDADVSTVERPWWMRFYLQKNKNKKTKLWKTLGICHNYKMTQGQRGNHETWWLWSQLDPPSCKGDIFHPSITQWPPLDVWGKLRQLLVNCEGVWEYSVARKRSEVKPPGINELPYSSYSKEYKGI